MVHHIDAVKILSPLSVTNYAIAHLSYLLPPPQTPP